MEYAVLQVQEKMQRRGMVAAALMFMRLIHSHKQYVQDQAN